MAFWQNIFHDFCMFYYVCAFSLHVKKHRESNRREWYQFFDWSQPYSCQCPCLHNSRFLTLLQKFPLSSQAKKVWEPNKGQGSKVQPPSTISGTGPSATNQHTTMLYHLTTIQLNKAQIYNGWCYRKPPRDPVQQRLVRTFGHSLVTTTPVSWPFHSRNSTLLILTLIKKNQQRWLVAEL